MIRSAKIADARRGGFTLRDEANAIVAEAFRNGPLERFHREDRGVGRITGPEMKELMINACETMESLLRLKASDPDEYALHVRSYNADWCENWERSGGDGPVLNDSGSAAVPGFRSDLIGPG